MAVDIHLNEYRNMITVTRYLRENVVDNETITKSETGTELLIRNCQKGESYRYLGNWRKFFKQPEEMGNKT